MLKNDSRDFLQVKSNQSKARQMNNSLAKFCLIFMIQSLNQISKNCQVNMKKNLIHMSLPNCIGAITIGIVCNSNHI